MNTKNLKAALTTTVDAAHKAGSIMNRNFRKAKVINESTRHDIKLELDIRCQEAIEKRLQKDFPHFAILGEEGTTGNIQSEYRWVIDPIDGTVNFTYDIPHACTSIALQKRISDNHAVDDMNYTTLVGVVHDPFTDETWTAVKGQKARLNSKVISVSPRRKLSDSMITLGFAKKQANISLMLPVFEQLAYKVKKIRMMGAAALSMTYVASGRFDAYLESGVRLWDIAAGGLIIESAGGHFGHHPIDQDHSFRLCVSNGHIARSIDKYFPLNKV